MLAPQLPRTDVRYKRLHRSSGKASIVSHPTADHNILGSKNDSLWTGCGQHGKTCVPSEHKRLRRGAHVDKGEDTGDNGCNAGACSVPTALLRASVRYHLKTSKRPAFAASSSTWTTRCWASGRPNSVRTISHGWRKRTTAACVSSCSPPIRASAFAVSQRS